MPFNRGSFSFTIFEISSELPENIIDLFAARKAEALDAVTADEQLGWVTGRHLLDTAIDGATAQLGGCYYLTLRRAARKIPASLLNALCKREEQIFMAANQLEYVSAKMRRQIREETIEKYIQKMPPQLSGIPMVLDPVSKLLFVGASSRSQLDLFIDNFYQTLKIEPVQLTPELLLERILGTTAASFPTLDLGGPSASEITPGRDFLLYLWYYSETVGKLAVEDEGEFDVLIEGPLLFAGTGDDNGSGEAVIKKGDNPLHSAEVKAAMSVGKKLKRAKLSITRDNQIWSGTFDADLFAFNSFTLPEGEEMNPDEIFADRIRDLCVFKAAISAYFKRFVEAMSGDNAVATGKAVREWIRDREAF